MLVASDTAENDVILLSALESIDTGYFNLLVQVFLQRPVELHIVDNIRALTLVRRHYPNLPGNNTRFEKLGDYLLYVRCLGPMYANVGQQLATQGKNEMNLFKKEVPLLEISS